MKKLTEEFKWVCGLSVASVLGFSAIAYNGYVAMTNPEQAPIMLVASLLVGAAVGSVIGMAGPDTFINFKNNGYKILEQRRLG